MNISNLRETKYSNVREIQGKMMTKKRKTMTHIKGSTSSSDDKSNNSFIEPPSKNMSHIKSITLSNDSDSMITVVQPKSKANKAKPPYIFMLRGITPGGQPRQGDLPEGTNKPLEQVPPTSYFGKLARLTGDTDPSSSDTSESDTSSASSSVSQREKLRKGLKRKSYRKKEKMRIECATKVKINLPSPYDGAADFEAFERWTYAVKIWIEITLSKTNVIIYVQKRRTILYDLWLWT